MFQTLPSLNGLRAFESVGRLESFSAAAEELMVTHCAVSRLVCALEKQLDIVLLESGRPDDCGRPISLPITACFRIDPLGVEEILGTQKSKALTLSCYEHVSYALVDAEISSFCGASR